MQHATPAELKERAKAALAESRALYSTGQYFPAREKFAEATNLANLAAEAEEFAADVE